MIQEVEAIYSGGVLKPTRELPFRDQQRVRLTVETIEEPVSDREEAIARLKAGIASSRYDRSGSRIGRLRRPVVSNSTPWNPRRSMCIAYLVSKPYISSSSGR